MTILAAAVLISAQAQDTSMTREQILNMSVDELAELPLEDLMHAVELLGVSSVDELFMMIMNKNVSSASKKEEDSFKSPLSSTVITREEMRTYGITTIEEAFRLIPGMIVTEKTNGIYDVQMRGLNSIPDNNMFLYTENANTLMMIDGRPVHNVAMGSVNFDPLPIGIEDIERIEVVRGACSALYGSNAVNGVINIITDRPNRESHTVTGSFQMGNQSTYSGDVAVRKAVNDKVAFGVTFNMQYRQRPTDKLWLIPSSGLYMATNSDNLPANGKEMETPYQIASIDGSGNVTGMNQYLYDGVIQNYGTADLQEAMVNYQTVFGSLVDVSSGGWYDIDEIQNIKQLYPSSYDSDGNITKIRIFDAIEPETPVRNMFPHPEIARKTLGFNGYVNLTPAEDITIYISGGYQNSYINSTPIGDDIFSFNGRTSKTWYAAVDASIKGLHILASDNGGPQNYAIGVPGFKFDTNIMNLNAEYDIDLPCGLSIRPGVNYMRAQYKDRVPDWTDADNYEWEYKDSDYRYSSNSYNNLSGFFMYDCTMNTFAPSVRLDYKIGDFRVIGAFREDKTDLPDQWTPSWQLAASYAINDNNFVRVVYGRANRGANMVNTAANFTWNRTNMVYPKKLKFSADPEADLMKADNIEIGYRWKPAQNILIDAEAFMSFSDNYGALMADYGSMNVTKEGLQRIVAAMQYGLDDLESKISQYGLTARDALKDPNMVGVCLSNLMEQSDMGTVLDPYASIKYNQLPYKVKQMGISLNMDYIISSKLIAKLNANIQRTTIDNYYAYSQTNDILTMLEAAQDKTIGVNSETPIIPYTSSLESTTKYRYNLQGELYDMFVKTAEYYAQGMSLEEANQKVQEDFTTWNDEIGAYQLGYTEIEDHAANTEDGHKHKATPAFYGMLGLIYKPLQQLEVSAFGNYIGKRTYVTKYGSDDLSQRFTVNMKIGYHPIQDFEVYFNAHNLLNNKKREFTHSDEIGGIYSVGVNFKF